MLICHRIVFAHNINKSLRTAQNPEGRFHHSGQSALYMSLSPPGAVAALRYYAKYDDPPRLMIEFALGDANLTDIRDVKTCETLGITHNQSNARWQTERMAGKFASTWRVSDIIRATGVDGMIYASRTQPDLSHLVLFRWNPPQLTQTGQPTNIAADTWR